MISLARVYPLFPSFDSPLFLYLSLSSLCLVSLRSGRISLHCKHHVICVTFDLGVSLHRPTAIRSSLRVCNRIFKLLLLDLFLPYHFPFIISSPLFLTKTFYN